MKRNSSPKQPKRQSSPPDFSAVPYDHASDDAKWRSAIRRQLTKWFKVNARVLPWRSEPTPYRVWVSEIMLQQTQVATVLPYYHRWMESYPTVTALADADEADLMRHWEGLGYYRRVRSMHAAAKKIVQEYNGEFPTDANAVLDLPGVGRYTAGAILSIACDQKMPILEGNTVRVFSRWAALKASPTETLANKWLWHFSEQMLPRANFGTFNQAAMELGALVCTPRNPNCDACPILNQCRTAALGLQQEIPGKVKKIKYEDRTEFALVLSRDQASQREYLMRKLPDDARWAGLWDFPRPTDVETSTIDCATQWLEDQIGTPVLPGPRLRTIRHGVTKYRIQLHVHAATVKSDSNKTSKTRQFPPDQWQWVNQDQLSELPLSVTGRKIADLVVKSEQQFLPLR
ncbi:A/G-specific adenine glycosylase [Stieleria sp. JC731]|uniref:A/G-specific adenine glycosylase n=1 Tax=Pirellulaceae TaxID=2691357 RepID=UPI001E5B9234|nr:A/G-specific adenine glycosylase [Stieleria sp. JC731]MCC9603281.1 A/G-specific adenine glycosylase [Stieleria sp. JC731]